MEPTVGIPPKSSPQQSGGLIQEGFEIGGAVASGVAVGVVAEKFGEDAALTAERGLGLTGLAVSIFSSNPKARAAARGARNAFIFNEAKRQTSRIIKGRTAKQTSDQAALRHAVAQAPTQTQTQTQPATTAHAPTTKKQQQTAATT